MAIGWNLYRDLSDRGRLRVTCYIGAVVGNGDIKSDLLVWTVTNVGRQPVMLTAIGGKLHKKGQAFIVNTQRPLPIMLKPGEYFIDWMDDYEHLDPDLLESLTAHSSVGTTYYAPRKEVEVVSEKIAALKAKPESQDGQNSETK